MINMDSEHEKMIERIYRKIVGDEFTEGLIPWRKRIQKNS